LKRLLADPRFDVSGVVHIVVVGQDFDVFDHDIDDGRVLQVLAKTPDCDPVASVDSQLRGVGQLAVVWVGMDCFLTFWQ